MRCYVGRLLFIPSSCRGWGSESREWRASRWIGPVWGRIWRIRPSQSVWGSFWWLGRPQLNQSQSPRDLFPPAFLTWLKASRGRIRWGSHSLSFPLLRRSLSLPRLGFLPPHHSRHLHGPNFLLLFSLLIQKGRGLPRVRSPWMGGDLASLRRKMKSGELQSN